MKRLLTGDKPGAIAAFQQCLATKQTDATEYLLAQAELNALLPAEPPVPSASAPVPVAPAPSP